jgi:hypothetical protein
MQISLICQMHACAAIFNVELVLVACCACLPAALPFLLLLARYHNSSSIDFLPLPWLFQSFVLPLLPLPCLLEMLVPPICLPLPHPHAKWLRLFLPSACLFSCQPCLSLSPFSPSYCPTININNPLPVPFSSCLDHALSTPLCPARLTTSPLPSHCIALGRGPVCLSSRSLLRPNPLGLLHLKP